MNEHFIFVVITTATVPKCHGTIYSGFLGQNLFYTVALNRILCLNYLYYVLLCVMLLCEVIVLLLANPILTLYKFQD